MSSDPSQLKPPYPASPGEEEVERVIYASQVTDRNGIYATMERIRQSALRHNPTVRIHVALLYQSGWFLHWAEGPSQAVNDLFERIRRDERHHSHHELHRSHGRRLLLTNWSMMMSPSTESAEEFGRRVRAMRVQMLAGTQFGPTSVIRRLILPMRLPQALELPDPEAYHRVVACAAVGNAAFDLAHWLAELHGVPVTSRRHAGEMDLDSGSDYVDFMQGAYPCRLVAVARSTLTHGLHRSLVPDWQFLVLLFSGDPKRDTALLERVHEAFHDLPRTPALLAIAPDARSFRHIEQVAREQGLTGLSGGLMTLDNCPAIWQTVSERLDQIGEPTASGWSTLEYPPEI